MIIPIPPVYRPGRRRPLRRKGGTPTPPPPPPEPPTLLAAEYVWSGLELTLMFDRAVNIDAFVPGSLVLRDGLNNATEYGVGTAELMPGTPTNLKIILTPIAVYAGDAVTLSVAAGNGIVAEDGGAAWNGVTNLTLPFP